MRVHRLVLTLAATGVFVGSLLAAGSALAQSTQPGCFLPQNAAEDAVDFSFIDPDPTNTGTCKSQCQGIVKSCKAAASAAYKCTSTADKAEEQAFKKQCKIDFPDNKDDRKSCVNEVQDIANNQKDLLKQNNKDAKDFCKEIKTDCIDFCKNPPA